MSDRIISRRLRINGTVQGVGFRPFVYVLGLQEKLNGTVLNDGEGVEAVLEGTDDQISRFIDRLQAELPPLAKIDDILSEEVPVRNLTGFRILESKTTSVNTGIPADAAVCADCLRELTDRTNRRYRYPFINCTHCGPRYTITRHLPYDRPQTSMSVFPMCPECSKEYKDPADRRFHAQPNACPVCGPHVTLVDNAGREIACADPIAELGSRIRAGEIAAVKGLGGFHLVCDARNAATVRKLRELKSRPSKPFAVMAANVESARSFLDVSAQAEKQLRTPAAPISLCPKLANADLEFPGIAPGLGSIGIMLPYTPIHWLLFFEAAGRPDDPDWINRRQELVLVMTSANYGGEPIVIGNDEAVKELGKVCSCFLIHDRDILVRCDDSVYLSNAAGEIKPIRRARGHTPSPVPLAVDCPDIIATGAWLKNTACVVKGKRAIVSQHVGDLDRVANCLTLRKSIEHLASVFEIRPKYVACDMHPDFYSTRLAEELAAELGAELIQVQHHHAHIASVMAQHGLAEPVIGLALDGVGYGTDGKAWGGELLMVDQNGFSREGHFKEVALPGGDKCAREGWRIAYALLWRNGLLGKAGKAFPYRAVRSIDAMLARKFPIPVSTSLGRLFDAAASLLSVADVSSYEGEAPALLEAVAHRERGQVLSGLVSIRDGILDIDPLLLSLAFRKDKERASADFHTTLAHALSVWAKETAKKRGIGKICLSGGCCLNDLLTTQLKENLKKCGLAAYESTAVPCNDGGVSLGQAWVAALTNLKKENNDHVSGNSRTN